MPAEKKATPQRRLKNSRTNSGAIAPAESVNTLEKGSFDDTNEAEDAAFRAQFYRYKNRKNGLSLKISNDLKKEDVQNAYFINASV